MDMSFKGWKNAMAVFSDAAGNNYIASSASDIVNIAEGTVKQDPYFAISVELAKEAQSRVCRGSKAEIALNEIQRQRTLAAISKSAGPAFNMGE